MSSVNTDCIHLFLMKSFAVATRYFSTLMPLRLYTIWDEGLFLWGGWKLSPWQICNAWNRQMHHTCPYSYNHAHVLRRIDLFVETQKRENTKTHSHTHSDTHSSRWPGLTCSWWVHLQTLNALELFPLELHLFMLVAQTLKKKHSQDEIVAQWNEAESSVLHNAKRPLLGHNPEHIVRVELIWWPASVQKTCAHVIAKRKKRAKICNHTVAVSLHLMFEIRTWIFSLISKQSSKLFNMWCNIILCEIFLCGWMSRLPKFCFLPSAFQGHLCR